MVRMAEEDNNKSRSRVRDLLYCLAVENELLEQENLGLWDAVATKKKQRKKGKALNLQQH
jgi:predicted kinase